MKLTQSLHYFRLATDFLAIGNLRMARANFEKASDISPNSTALQAHIAQQAIVTIKIIDTRSNPPEKNSTSGFISGFHYLLSARDERRFCFRGFYQRESKPAVQLAPTDIIEHRLITDKTTINSFSKDTLSAEEIKFHTRPSLVRVRRRNAVEMLNLRAQFAGLSWQERPAREPRYFSSVRVSPFHQLSGDIQWLDFESPLISDLHGVVKNVISRLVL